MLLNLSDETIEKKANELRDRIGMDYVYALDPETVLQRMKNRTNLLFRLADSGELEDSEAFMDCDNQVMLLSAKVMSDMRTPKSRARFTVAHEIGHYLLGHTGNTKRNPDKAIYMTPKQRIQEQQADLFASYLLVPTKLAMSSQSAKEIEDRFQVSPKVAEIAFERVQALIRKATGTRRRPPAVVVDFLKAAEKQGYKVKSDLSDF